MGEGITARTGRRRGGGAAGSCVRGGGGPLEWDVYALEGWALGEKDGEQALGPPKKASRDRGEVESRDFRKDQRRGR